MNSNFRKPLSWLVAQSIVAISLPVASLAATSDLNVTGNFELPINEKLEVSLPAPQKLATIASAAHELRTPGLRTPGHAPLPGSSSSVNPSAPEAKPVSTAVAITVTTPRPLATTKPRPASVDKDILDIEDVLGEKTATFVDETGLIDKDVLVVDSDASAVAQEQDQVWNELKDQPGMTRISSGSCFPVAILSQLSSKTAKVGDPIEARLKTDIKIGGKHIASKGDKVRGHVSSCSKARRILHAELSKNRWMRANGCIGLQFDEIITKDGEHLPLVAKPARRARIVKNENEGRVLGVNDNGEIAAPLSTQLKHQAGHLAIRGAASVGGVLSFGIVPAAYGIVGAINPSFAFLHPVGKNVPHRRLKGFAMGLASGLPGGFLIADTIIKGAEAEIKPGDEFLAMLHQEFTGEAATSATLIPGASQKVRGQVLNSGKAK